MAAAGSFDLYTCEVCFENMLDRNPRLLSCHHSFCSNCLVKLTKNGSILCPTCREETAVPNNDINMLTANFMLQKMKEHLDKIHASKSSLCQLCRAEPALLKCQECLQLLCNDCSYKHNKVKKFRDHKIYNLCKKHPDVIITNVCMKCAEPACSNCVINEHLDHESEMDTYDEGIETMCQELKQNEGKLDELTESANNLTKENKVKATKIKDSISIVNDIELYYEKKLHEVKETLKALEVIASDGDSLIGNIEETVKEWKKAKHSIPKTINELRQGDLVNYINLKQQLDRILKEKLNRVKYDPPIIEIEDPRTRTMLNLTSVLKTDVYLKEPKFIKEVRCPKNETWSRTWNISSTDNDCVLICDWYKSYITCAYSSDKPTTTIPAVHGEVRDACVYQGYLYTAYKDCVSKRTFNNGNTGQEVMLKPDIKEICSIVVNNKCMYILSNAEGKVFEFNLSTNTTREVVNNLKNPRNLNVIQKEGCVEYCVSCYGTHSVMVYDDTWNLLFTLGGPGSGDGQLSCPWGVTCTTEGILVADQMNHRISQFSFEGTFMKHILSNKDNIGCPLSIAFNSPYLCLTRANRVKCFKICE